jgi:solute carrier family 13 (sodium-dependent dicarboxylate transporter), member 2/3/5
MNNTATAIVMVPMAAAVVALVPDERQRSRFGISLISNTATVALILPTAASLSGTLGIDPLLLMIPVKVATAYGFMMPLGTPPNAIAFASGYVTAPKMARIGVVLDIIGIVLVSLITAILLPLVWN